MTWPEHIGVAVNVSPVQFRHPAFCQTVIDIVGETGLAPSRLELEITEGVMLQNTEATLATLRRLQAFGIKLVMDDFGTGYSSLGYLQKFHFDKIKIDRSFTVRVDEDSNAEAIVRAVIGMSESLGVSINAEGVETSTQAEVLRSLGCAEGQGFLYSRPVPGEQFDALVRESAEGGQNPRPAPDPEAPTARPVLVAARPVDNHG
jgi:EAL domain-containing protein (putative c-di-GMP-specific phosphodiesterase class I)